MPEDTGGDRYGFETFDCAPGLRLEANERLHKMQFDSLKDHITRLEQTVERLERRLWLAVYGVVAAILVQAFQPLLAVM